LVWILAASLPQTSLWAQQPSPREQARLEFERGVQKAQEGDLDGAVAAFEAAYAASPHYSVLFNLAQAYAALGKAVEAASAFERYLTLAEHRIPEARRAEVGALLALQRRRIGWLKVQVEPAGAELRINGQRIPDTDRTIALTVGQYGVAVTREGFAPFVEQVQVTAATTRELTVRLVRNATGEASSTPGLLSISCALPETEVMVDGARVALTPVAAPLMLPAGPHQVTFQRLGYVFPTQRLTLESARTLRVSCAPEQVQSASTPTAALTLRIGGPNAEVLVDGQPYRDGRLPVGLHRVQATRENYQPWSQDIRLAASEARTLTIALQPTPSHLLELRAAERQKRNWALGLGAGSLVLAGGALATFVWNSGRYGEWRDQSLATDRALMMGDPAALQQNGKLRDQASNLQAMDDLALGLAIGAGTLAAASVVLWLLRSEQPAGQQHTATNEALVTW
jgi:hypothetical protein